MPYRLFPEQDDKQSDEYHYSKQQSHEKPENSVASPLVLYSFHQKNGQGARAEHQGEFHAVTD